MKPIVKIDLNRGCPCKEQLDLLMQEIMDKKNDIEVMRELVVLLL